ncbi:MAG: amidase [Acidocella sp.]|nr:amidase [Acidocella sp.]
MFAEYASYDATGLAGLIASGEVSAAEVLEAALAKIAAGEPRLNAMVEILAARAQAQIAAAERPPGPFSGVPFLLKDIYQEYAGAKATRGAVALRDYIAPHDSELTKRFLAAGVVIAGSTATPELGLKATTETILHGATRNPWHPGTTPGGSSGGSAAAVAARYVPMAGASDGGGSIRIPASYCGLFGLKPSRGRVPCGPDFAEIWDGAVASGVLSRSVRDSAIMLDAIAGPEPGGPFIIAPPAGAYAQEVGAETGRLRIGFSTASPVGGRIDPEQITAVQNAARLLESLGHVVEEAAPAIDGRQLFRCFMTMYYGHVAAGMRAVRALTGADASTFHTDTRTIALLGDCISGADYVAARTAWHDFARALGVFHEHYDIFLTPVTAMGAARIGELDTKPADERAAKLMIMLRAGKLLLKSGIAEKLAFTALERTPFTQLANMAFVPAMSVPLHWGADGMPVGVHFSAKFGAEDVLIRLASQLEAAQPWAARVPAGFE